MIEIELKVRCKKNEYDWKGESASFDVNLDSPEFINAIDLNTIKNVLLEKAITLQAEKDAEEALEEKDEESK